MMRAFASQDFFAGRHAGAIDQPVQAAESVRARGDRRLPLLVAGHVGCDKARGVAQFLGEIRAGAC